MTEDEYIARGYELYVFHERETGAECRVFARSLYDAKCTFRRMVTNRKLWQKKYAEQNAEAMKPFDEKRKARLAKLYSSTPDLDNVTFFDICNVEVETSEPPIHIPSRYHKRSQHDGSVQLELDF